MRFILFCVLVTGLAATAFGQTESREELERQRAEIQREIADVKRILDQTTKSRKASLAELSLLQRKLRLRQSAIANINRQINVIDRDIVRSRSDIEKLRRELDTLKMQYEKSIVYAYKNRSSYDFLSFIFSASSFNDALKRVQYLKSYRQYREQQTAAILATQEQLRNKIAALEKSRQEKDVVLERQQKEREELDAERRQRAQVVNKLKSREKELGQELSAKQKADQKLRASIKAAIDREIRLARQRAAEEEKRQAALAANTPAGSPARTEAAARPTTRSAESRSVFDATPGGELISDNFEKNRGNLPWPVDKGNIKINFGRYAIPGTRLAGTNPGLTLETEQGATVKCVFDGEVVSVFDVDGESNVLVRHGKYFTTYGHLAQTFVKKGQQVRAGETLGRAATNADGNGEVEFLLLLENKNLDPGAWIRKR